MALVTVSEVLRFALPAGTTLLAGAAGLSRTVTWARLLRARPSTVGSVEQGEVWILSSGALQQAAEARALPRLIRDVGDAGVVAFVAAEAMPSEACAEAEAASIPILLLPVGASLVETEKAIVGLVMDHDRAIGQRVQQVHDRLLATLEEDQGAELLAGIVHEVAGKAVYILDEHFQATVQAGGGPRTASALADLRRRLGDGGTAPTLDGRQVSLRPPDGAHDLAAIVRPLLLRGAIEGYLALVGGRDDFSDFDHQVAIRAASVAVIELAKQGYAAEARLRLQGDFLTDLLDDSAPVGEALALRARSLGYDLIRPHIVFVLRLRSTPDGEPSPREYQRFVQFARRRLVVANPATLLRDRDDAVQVVMPSPEELDTSNVEDVMAMVEHLRSQIQDGLAADAAQVVAGIGRMPDTAVPHFAALREAMQAAEIAMSLPNGSPTLHFAQLGALRLIFHLTGHPELRAFQDDLLGPLEEYDRAHRSELLQTLEAFFRAGGNHMQAARDLHVHRNTLIYRLDRIRDLLGRVDLEEPDTRLNLQLAIKIRSALGPIGEPRIVSLAARAAS